jgi:hypothetical protein
MKCASAILIVFTVASPSTVSFAGGIPSSYAPSGHKHHSSQGDHSHGGRGSSHKGGQSKHLRTGHHYTRHPKSG